jgi:E3 ubiquitin-protein ligase SHPRH
VTAAELADADVVLTTFDVLANDVSHDAEKSGGSPIRGKRVRRYPIFPTPLVRLTWWRVVIDEAQMIEGGGSKAAQMANHLAMVNRWCVTGTPISRGINDVHGLISFLKVQPWAPERRGPRR